LNLYNLLPPKGYDYFFLNEHDTNPIRPGWVDKLIAEVSCGQEFWIKGSIFRKADRKNIESFGYHINGNALYNSCSRDINCYNWTRYILDDLYGNSFDHAGWWVYFSPKNVELGRDRLHYYIYSDFVYNQFHRNPWSSATMREENKNTYFVHGKQRIRDEGD